jgi:primosomal protein N' (replication factor Y)
VCSAKQQNLFGIEADEPAWETAAQDDRLTADVVFNRAVDEAYSYLVPDRLRGLIAAGQRVKAPFGKGDRPAVGYCVSVGPPRTTHRLKTLEAILDREPLLSPEMLRLTRWIADHYLCAWGQVLEGVVPAGVKKHAGTRLLTYFRPADNAVNRAAELKLTAKQRAVLDVLLSAGGPLRGDELAELAGCGAGPIQLLRGKGVIVATRRRTLAMPTATPVAEPAAEIVLNADQLRALDAIRAVIEVQRHETILLHGVTGSGKTEVYIRAIQEVVGYGRQAIVLVPEISLTPQTIRRFRSRFNSVAVLHSHLSDAERHWQWQQIARGAVQVVVGARSAVFAPAPHLGMIVIDEEHETTFKQETVPRYHAVEVARQRAVMRGVPLILGSATPTLESWLRVQQGHDRLLSLPNRVEALPLPPVTVVDVRNDPQIGNGQAIGRALQTAMRQALGEGGQVILFLNLRGYSPALWCRSCGESLRCPNCDVSLTWHRDRGVVICHFCELTAAPPERCPRCGKPGLRYVGIGTQRLEQEVRIKFPDCHAVRMDSDSMKKPGSHDVALEAFRRGEVRILLGTQMIAKGLDFPNVTLVGVIDADTMLHQPDLRAAERTFQLLAQVSGRTGRSRRGGRVLVQTANPEEPAIKLAAMHDYPAFAERELKHRRELQSPPFVRMARVILRGPREELVKETARSFAEQLRAAAETTQSPVRILGPAPAPAAKLKSLYRYHFRLTAPTTEQIHTLWKQVAPQLPRASDVEFVIDVDPLNMR